MRIGLARAACVAGLLVVTAGIGAPAYGSSGTVPFTDPAADGYVGLCDMSGHNITSGSVTTGPFVWKAVSSVVPPKSYRGRGQNTGLFIYQARQGVQPGDWSGDELTSDSVYRHASEPTAAATYKDYPLKVFMTEYPPLWDGLYVLRMQFGKAGYGVYATTYPMSVIQVTGDSWHVVSGGKVNCSRAVAVSQETASAGIPQVPKKPVKGETPVTAPAAMRAGSGPPSSTHGASKAGSSSGGAAGSAAGSGGLQQSASQPIDAAVSLPQHKHGVSSAFIVVLIVLGLVAAAVAGAFVGRRRPVVRSE